MWRMATIMAGIALAAPAAAAPYETARIVVTVEGQGPDVLLIPGLASSPDAWRTVTPKLPGYRFHYVQVKGFAGTPADGNAADGRLLPALAEELARYIAQARIRPAVVGHSMGGSLAMMLAAGHPTAMTRVMVVDMVPYMGAMFAAPDARPEAVRAMADAGARAMTALDDTAYRARIAASTGVMVRDAALRGKAVEQALASDRALVTATFAELTALDLRPALARIAVPMEVAYVTPAIPGITDGQIDAIFAAAYAPVAGVTLVRAPASAHFVMWDNPDWFAARLRAFLAR